MIPTGRLVIDDVALGVFLRAQQVAVDGDSGHRHEPFPQAGGPGKVSGCAAGPYVGERGQAGGVVQSEGNQGE